MTDEFLTPDAMRPSDADLLEQLARDRGKRRTRATPPPTNARKNRLSMDRDTGQLYGGPGSRPRQHATDSETLKKNEEEIRKRIAQKRKRASELESKIMQDANELLADFLHQGMGVPKEFIWKSPPPEKVIDSNYTPWMNRIAISPWSAKIWAMTIAEMETSDLGGKVEMTIGQDSPFRMLILAGASIFMVGRQAKAIIDLRTEIAPYMEAWKRAKAEAEERQKGQTNATV